MLLNLILIIVFQDPKLINKVKKKWNLLKLLLFLFHLFAEFDMHFDGVY